MPPNLPACIDTGSRSGMEPSATVRKFLHICISGNALSSHVTWSLILSREMRKRERHFGLDEGMFCTRGSPLLITWQKQTATLCAMNGGLGCSRFLWLLLKSAPNAKMLCTEDGKQLGEVIHLLFKSHGKAQIKTSLELHTFTALAICLSTSRMYQGTVFKPISCFQTNLAKRYRLLFISAKANAKQEILECTHSDPLEW